MEYNEQFKSVYTNYIEKRKIHLSEDQFMAMVTALPALLVAKADGVVDKEEKNYLHEIATTLAKQFVKEAEVNSLTDTFSHEFEYILKHLSDWKIDFIELTADYLNENPEKKDEIKKEMVSVAQISQGISLDEKMFIEHLIRTLNL